MGVALCGVHVRTVRHVHVQYTVHAQDVYNDNSTCCVFVHVHVQYSCVWRGILKEGNIDMYA